jgi:hypothetical protein
VLNKNVKLKEDLGRQGDAPVFSGGPGRARALIEAMGTLKKFGQPVIPRGED